MVGLSRYLAGAALCALVTTSFLTVVVAGQTFGVTPANLAAYTSDNKFERFPDGRPKVPDALLNTMREMKLEVEEAWALVRGRGYVNAYEANWKVLIPETRLIGRAFTVQFIPARPDLAAALQTEATAKGIGGLRNQTAIDMLQKDDVAVVDLFGKIDGGTFVGDKLAYYIQKTTGTGLVVDGALFYLNRLAASGMPAYYRDSHPSSLTNVTLSGVNVPIRIGNAIVMPGDIVLGDRDGILFIPPHLVEEVIASAKTQRLRDQWVKGKFDLGKYKSSEIYGRPTDPALLKEFLEFTGQTGTTGRGGGAPEPAGTGGRGGGTGPTPDAKTPAPVTPAPTTPKKGGQS
jgi:4-hydroxy-4-methyl-2-oxoglutarate aldolase